jgi:hypothetical protein
VRATLLSGAVLTVGSILLVVLSASLGLGIESVALMGAGSGAVVALVPGRSPLDRLIGFVVGFAVSWLGYLLRAGFLPDTTAGHAIAVAAVVAICSVVAALSRERLPLWTLLLGAAVLAGSYETTYIEAPSQVLRTSTSTSTSVLLAVALGFFAAALVAPRPDGSDATEVERTDAPHAPSTTSSKTPAQTTSKESGSVDDTKLGVMMKEEAR